MSEWVYKATRTKIGFEDTENFALKYNFLARSAYHADGQRPALVSSVMPNDIIHFYYRLHRKHVPSIGSFRVLDGAKRFPDRFSDYVAKTALVGVKESNVDFIRELERDNKLNPSKGYVRDPVLKVFTGWAIEKLDDVKAPEFNQQKLFRGPNITLWHYPHPGSSPESSA